MFFVFISAGLQPFQSAQNIAGLWDVGRVGGVSDSGSESNGRRTGEAKTKLTRATPVHEAWFATHRTVAISALLSSQN